MDEGMELFELDFWQGLVKSDEWKYFKGVLMKHKEYLEKQVLLHVSRKEFDEAMKAGARADECGKILQLVVVRLGELREETNGV